MGSLLVPETMLVIALVIGGFAAARFGTHAAPSIEMVHLRETTPFRRYVEAFIGGFFIIFGARLAGGCTGWSF
jgi:uncharacterized membrane protein YedE/YeeE